jgi:ADP-ribose pyrophosphatase
MEPASVHPAYRGSFLRVDLEAWPGLDAPLEIVRHPGAAGVLPVTPAGDVLLVRQFRPAIRDSLTEIPAGVLDVPGEDPLACATRELFEETGYRHQGIEFMGGTYSSAGFSDEYIHLFVARTDPLPEAEPERGITLVRRPLPTMVAAARAGRVRDAKTALALLLVSGHPYVRAE